MLDFLNKIKAKIRAKFIDDLASLKRLLTVRFAIVVGALPEVTYRVAELVLYLGDHLPGWLAQLAPEVVSGLPPWLRGAAPLLSLVAVLLRAWKQTSLHEEPAKGPGKPSDLGNEP